jgi:hypothetical protein
MNQLHREGKLPDSVAQTARVLVEWLATEHPNESQAKAKSLENGIRDEYKALRRNATNSAP